MYKRLLFAIAFIHLLTWKAANAQTIKLDNGILLSSFRNSKNLPILHENIASYSVSAGVDFLEKKWFYLSSQIGYVRIGGKEENPFLSPDFSQVSESKSYIHLNTTFRGYKNISNLKIFVGAGPFTNIVTGSKRFETSLYHEFYELKTYAGAKGELGITEDFNKVRVGLVGGYLLSLTDVGTSSSLKLGNNNWSVSLSVGYKISR
jgi:hypothetical protein